MLSIVDMPFLNITSDVRLFEWLNDRNQNMIDGKSKVHSVCSTTNKDNEQ